MISAIIGPRVNGVMHNRYYTEKDVINCIFHRCRKSIRAFHACRFKEEMTSLFYTSRRRGVAIKLGPGDNVLGAHF